MQWCRPWRRRSAPGSEAVGCRLQAAGLAVGCRGTGARRGTSVQSRSQWRAMSREWPAKSRASDETSAQQRGLISSAKATVTVTDDAAVTDGRRAVLWVAEGGVGGRAWLAGGAEERPYRAPNVNLDGSSSSQLPQNRRARTITRLPAYLSILLARSLPLCLSISPASFVPLPSP
jgi:hypothetical protein